MKSSFRTTYGSPDDVLRVKELEMPTPQGSQIVVQVMATTVNRTDCGGLWGKPYIFRFFVGWPKPRHLATGSDFAGIVHAVGPQASRFKVGDRVFGLLDHGLGTHAQYACIDERKPIALLPDHVDFDTAVASLEGAHYAYSFIKKLSFTPGQRVMVNGGTGAIGSAAIQLLKGLGLHVTATCRTEHIQRVQQLGADRVLDYTKEDFTALDERFPLVFDAVGKSSFGQCKRILAADGIYVSTELGPRNENPLLAIVTPWRRGPRVIFPFPIDPAISLQYIKGLLEKGSFHPLIDRVYPLEQVGEAFNYVNSGQKVGNVLIHPF